MKQKSENIKTEVNSEVRGRRIEVTGEVISNKMNKTISVLIYRLVKHGKYGKYMKKIIQLGDERLRIVCDPIPESQITSKESKKLVKDLETALASQKDGVAISAPQIGETKQLFVIGGIVFGEFECDVHQVQAIHPHPTGCVRLFQYCAAGKKGTAIKDADIIEAQESAFKDIIAFSVFAINPPGEIQQQLVKNAFEKRAILTTPDFLLDLLNA